MDSKKIFCFFCLSSFLLLSHHQSHARTPNNGTPKANQTLINGTMEGNQTLTNGTLQVNQTPTNGTSDGNQTLVNGTSKVNQTLTNGTSQEPPPGLGSIQLCCYSGNLTACIEPSTIGSGKLLVSVKNDGEELQNVTLSSISHAKHIIQEEEIQVPGQKMKEVNVSANLGANSSILVEAGNLGCRISVGSTASSGGNFGYVPLYISHTTGVYLLFLTGLILGTTWACYKWGKSGKHGDGVSYQQLGIGQRANSPSANNVETVANDVETAAEGWEQDWDGDWDELKSKAAKGSSANGLASQASKRVGQETNRDD